MEMTQEEMVIRRTATPTRRRKSLKNLNERKTSYRPLHGKDPTKGSEERAYQVSFQAAP